VARAQASAEIGSIADVWSGRYVSAEEMFGKTILRFRGVVDKKMVFIGGLTGCFISYVGEVETVMRRMPFEYA